MQNTTVPVKEKPKRTFFNKVPKAAAHPPYQSKTTNTTTIKPKNSNFKNGDPPGMKAQTRTKAAASQKVVMKKNAGQKSKTVEVVKKNLKDKKEKSPKKKSRSAGKNQKKQKSKMTPRFGAGDKPDGK